MDFLTNDLLLGDFLSPLNQSCLAAEESLGLLDECLEVAEHLRSQGFSSFKTKDALSDWLPVDSLLNATGRNEEDAFSGMDWMVEKMDLKGFDFDSLLGTEDMETTVSPDDLLAVLEGSCDLLDPPDLLDEAPFQTGLGNPTVPEPFTYCPESPFGADQVAPSFSPAPSPDCLDSSPICEVPPECVPFPVYLVLPLSLKREMSTPEQCVLSPSQESLSSTLDHSFSLEVGSNVDVTVRERPTASYVLVVPKGECEEEASDDSGISLSPPYLASPEQSSDVSLESSLSPASYTECPKQSPASLDSTTLSSPESPISARPKPYDPPTEDKVLARVKVAGGERKLDKKTKKMEQNKTAATRYRQKKRAEQEAISAECRELEGRNDALQDRVDSLAKEIQYLKGLIEEVREAKSKRTKTQSVA